jgi:hypothetical protein
MHPVLKKNVFGITISAISVVEERLCRISMVGVSLSDSKHLIAV